MSRRAAAPTKSHRPDIQGLRALAVVAVIIEHAIHWPRGGFVGVDVFFVLSGFLITGLLLREHNTTGKISMSGFYLRRIRRIVPAAFLVLALTVPATWALYGSGRGSSVAQDAGAAAGFFANWRYAITGTDYFQADGPTSPLQHYWSLSVEEQFYLVWPVLMIALFAITTRRSGLASQRSAFIGISVIGAVSLVWAILESSSNPTVAYFSTFSRAWELAAGAALAFATPLLARLPQAVRELLAWAGLAVVVGSMFIIVGDRGFPAPWGILPVVGSVMIIAAGTGAQPRSFVVLTNPVAKYLGDISYSLYLWHFPVLIVGGPYLLFLMGSTQQTPMALAILFAAILAVSVASYHLVERPILRSKWLLPKEGKGLAAYRRRVRRPYILLLTGGVAAAAVLGAAWQLNGLTAGDNITRPGAAAAEFNGADDVADGTGTTTSAAQKQLTAQINTALSATKWPAQLSPSPENPMEETVPGNTARCGSVAWLPAPECTFGAADAPKKAVLVGDSIAQAYVPALAKIFGTGEWSLRITSMYACPFVDLRLGSAASSADACERRRDQERQAVAETKPDLLIVGNTFFRNKDAGTGIKATLTSWHTGFASAMKSVTKDAKATVVLSPPPLDKTISSCYSAFAGPQACISNVSASDSTWLDMYGDQARSAKELGYTLIDSRPWFCNSGGRCPAFVGDLLTKKDQAHPTALYVEHLEPLIKAGFADAGVFKSTEGGTNAGSGS